MPYRVIAGVYAITNTITGTKYVGSSKTVLARMAGHKTRLRNGEHPNPHLQAAWDKYGPDAFTFSIIETTGTWQQALAREQEHIQVALHSGQDIYNIRLLAASNTGVKFGPKSEQFKQSLRERYAGKPGVPWTEERRKQHGEKLRGRPRPREAIERMAAKQRGVPCPQRGRKGKVISAEALAHVREAARRPERREKLRAARLGHVFTPEQRANMSAARKLDWERRKTRARAAVEMRSADASPQPEQPDA